MLNYMVTGDKDETSGKNTTVYSLNWIFRMDTFKRRNFYKPFNWNYCFIAGFFSSYDF